MIGHSAKSKRHFYYFCSRSFKQGKDACNARMLPKGKLEKLVTDQLRSRVLSDNNLEKLVTLVNNELQSASCLLKDRLDVIDTELKNVKSRLARLYDALETGKLKLDELAPRIRELKYRQDELSKIRVQVEAEMVAQGVEEVDMSLVKSYAETCEAYLRSLNSLREKPSFAPL